MTSSDKMSSIYCVIFGIFFASSLGGVSTTDVTFVNRVTCDETSATSSDQCDSCLMKTKISPWNRTKGIMFFDYIHEIKARFHYVGNQTLIWTFPDLSQINLSNVIVTLAIWNERTKRARPIPGCCSISIMAGQCKLAECISSSNRTVIAYSYKRMNVMKTMMIPKDATCETNPTVQPTVRYFTICVDEETTWKQRYNCECAVYDSNTGMLLPGNETSQVIRESSEGGVWFFDDEPQQYQVCVFTMNKRDVMKRGFLADDSLVMDSVAFNRGVFHMPGFSCVNGSVIDEILGEDVNCSMKIFKGSQMFSISSRDIQTPEMNLNNDSFTCMMPWPTGSGEMMPMGAHVKCMPQNETFPSMSHVYTMKKTNSFVDTMTIFIPLFIAAAVMSTICLLTIALRKKYNKIVKEAKKVPEELNTVMRDYLHHSSAKTILFANEVKEEYQALDREEQNRILSLRSKKRNNQTDRQSEIFQISNDFHALDTIQHFNSNPNEEAEKFQKHASDQITSSASKTSKKSKSDFHSCSICEKSSLDVKEENDSGCPGSISSSVRSLQFEEESPVTSGMSYCLHHEANSSSHAEEDDVFSISSMESNDKPSIGGYWSKNSLGVTCPGDRVSHCSDDTGCGSESDESCNKYAEEETDFVTSKNGADDKKHPFFKTTSKDSGVVTEVFRINSIESLSDVSEDCDAQVLSYPPPIHGYQGKMEVI